MNYLNEKSRQMDNLLRAAGLAPKETHVYGSQVVVTVRSRAMAQKVASFLKQGTFTLRGIVEAVDLAKENKNTVLRPSTVKVYRVFARA